MTDLGTGDAFTAVVGSIVFWLAALISLLGAIGLVFFIRNLVRATLALTAVLGGVAALYATLGADFLTVVQLVVYVGAIMVLIIFAIFMTPGQVDVPGQVGRVQNVGALLVALVFGVVSCFVLITAPWNERAAAINVPTTQVLGDLMMTRYVLPFEIASLLLTVALVGAIVVARED